nr:immunoglobulin heavy chain junction region [Mus musculus]
CARPLGSSYMYYFDFW